MNIYEAVKNKLINAGFSDESSETLAQFLALHYPEHTAALLEDES